LKQLLVLKPFVTMVFFIFDTPYDLLQEKMFVPCFVSEWPLCELPGGKRVTTQSVENEPTVPESGIQGHLVRATFINKRADYPCTVMPVCNIAVAIHASDL
jgi:hypothetical protein